MNSIGRYENGDEDGQEYADQQGDQADLVRDAVKYELKKLKTK